MQTSENAPKVEGALNAEDSPIVESAATVESTDYRSGFYREAGFYDAHSLPGYGAQSPVTREAFAYDFFPATGDISSPCRCWCGFTVAPGASAPTRPYAALSCAPWRGAA